MADIFQEIDEDLQRERAGRLWAKYGIHVIAAAVAVVVAVGGWRAWDWYRTQQAQAAGARFQDAMRLSLDGKDAEAQAAFSTLAKDAPSGYQVLARFSLAGEAGRRNAADGVAAFDALAADGTVAPLLQDVAKVRAGYLLVDTAAYADLLKRIEPLTGAGEPMRHSAREILGLSAWKARDFVTASKWFEAVVGDADVPGPARQRADVMLQLIAGDAPARAAS